MANFTNFKIFTFALVIIFFLAGFVIATNDNANATNSLIIGKDIWNASQIGVVYLNMTKLNSTQSSNNVIFNGTINLLVPSSNVTTNSSIINTTIGVPIFNVSIINGSSGIVYPNVSVNITFPPIIIINFSQNDTISINVTIINSSNSTPPVQMPAPNSTTEIIIINNTQPTQNATSNSTTTTHPATYPVSLYNIKLSPPESKCRGEVFVRFYAFNNVNRALNNVRIKAKILDNVLALGNKTFDIPKWMGIYQNISFKVPINLKSGENKYTLEIWAEDNFGRLSASEAVPFLVSCENVNQFGNVSTKEFINITYNYLLHRSAEQAGLNYWAKWISHRAQKNARLNFMYQVYLSQEYQSFNKVMSKSNKEFVNFIFQDLLGRKPTDKEISKYLNTTKSKKGRDNIAKKIVYSDEFKNVFDEYIINFTKSQVDKCASHYLNITGVRNVDGKLAVDYSSIGVNKAEVGLSREGWNMSQVCSPDGGACSGHSGSPIAQCTVYTLCDYPSEAGKYLVKVSDPVCVGENIHSDYNLSIADIESKYLLERDFGSIIYRSSEWGIQADVVDVLGTLFEGIKDGAFARYTIENTPYDGDLGIAIAEFDRNISYDEMKRFLAVFNETNYTIEYQYINEETNLGEIDLSGTGSLPGAQVWVLGFREIDGKKEAAVLWTSGNKLIFIAIEDVRAFEEDNLKSFGLFIKAYLTKYPSTLLVKPEKSFVFYTDSNGKKSIKVDALIKDGMASFNILYGDGKVFLGNGKDAKNKLAMPALASDSNVLIYNITGGDKLFIASQNYLGNINNGESYLLSATLKEFNGSNSVSIRNEVTGDWICEYMPVGNICDFGAARLQVADLQNSNSSKWIKIYGSGSGSSFTRIYDASGTKFINLPYVELHYPFQYIASGTYV